MKPIRKEILFGFVVVIAIIIISIIVLNSQTFLTTEVQECIAERQETSHPDFIPRVLTVRFKENITESEALGLIQQHGLVLSEFDYYSRVIVPTGGEINWLCILENSDFVEKASLNYKTELA
jgi:hypothetical protein